MKTDINVDTIIELNDGRCVSVTWLNISGSNVLVLANEFDEDDIFIFNGIILLAECLLSILFPF